MNINKILSISNRIGLYGFMFLTFIFEVKFLFRYVTDSFKPVTSLVPISFFIIILLLYMTTLLFRNKILLAKILHNQKSKGGKE